MLAEETQYQHRVCMDDRRLQRSAAVVRCVRCGNRVGITRGLGQWVVGCAFGEKLSLRDSFSRPKRESLPLLKSRKDKEPPSPEELKSLLHLKR